MVKVTYTCGLCDEEFDNFEEANKHEKIPIKEGDYQGILLKDNKNTCLILAKTEELTMENHERIYGLYQSCTRRTSSTPAATRTSRGTRTYRPPPTPR